jgi:hypothetical protein
MQKSAKRFGKGLYTYRAVRIEKTKRGWEFQIGMTLRIAEKLRDAKWSIDSARDN